MFDLENEDQGHGVQHSIVMVPFDGKYQPL